MTDPADPIPGYYRHSPWKPVAIGIPSGLAIGFGLAWLPDPWGLYGILLFGVIALAVCAYLLIDLRRDQRRLHVLLRRMRYRIEQDREDR